MRHTFLLRLCVLLACTCFQAAQVLAEAGLSVSVPASAWRAEGGALNVTAASDGTLGLETPQSGPGWGNCYAEGAADVSQTPLLIVRIAGLSPQAQWSLTVNDSAVHALKTASQGVGRFAFDLRQTPGLPGHKFRLYLTVHHAGQRVEVAGVSFEAAGPAVPRDADEALVVDGWNERDNAATVATTPDGALRLTNGTTGGDNWGGLRTTVSTDAARPFLEVEVRHLSPGARWRVEAGNRISGPEQRNTGLIVLPCDPAQSGPLPIHLIVLGSGASLEVVGVRLVAAPTASEGLLRRLRQAESAPAPHGPEMRTGSVRAVWDSGLGVLRISRQGEGRAALLTRLYECPGVDFAPASTPAGKDSPFLLQGRTASGGVLYQARLETFPDTPGLLHFRVTATAQRAGERLSPGGQEMGYLPSFAGATLQPLATQNLIATALVQAEAPGIGTVVYVQDLTALNPLFEQSGASPRFLAGCGARTFGTTAPISVDRELPEGKPLVVSEAYLYLTAPAAANTDSAENRAIDRAYGLLKGLAVVYEKLTPPEIGWRDWPDLAERTVQEFQRPGVFLEYNGQDYLQGYLGQAGNSPTLSAPQDVLAPLLRYRQRLAPVGGKSRALADTTLRRLDGTLPTFVSPLHKTLQDSALPGEHAWYDPAPHANLARAALLGDATARAVCLQSVDGLIDLAHQTNYSFQGENLFTYENQSAGTYLLFLVLCHDLTGEARFLDEAKRAADHLTAWSPAATREIFWTAMTAEGLSRLYEKTKDRRYLRLSLLPLAEILRNTWLWECDFGHAKSYTTFWGMNADASGIDYIAPMEQHQTWYALREYYLRTQSDLPAPVRLLVSELLRGVPETVWFTYPAHLPAHSLLPADRKTFWQTTNNYDAFVPVEDLNDGWRKNGSVGQELYGVGAAFQIASLACTPVPEAGIRVYCEYPLLAPPRWEAASGKLTLRIGGVHSHLAKMEIRPLPGATGPKAWFGTTPPPPAVIAPLSALTATHPLSLTRTAETGKNALRIIVPGDSQVIIGR